jgi:hypothetical protein
MNYHAKYLKYKSKYLNEKLRLTGGGGEITSNTSLIPCNEITFEKYTNCTTHTDKKDMIMTFLFKNKIEDMKEVKDSERKSILKKILNLSEPIEYYIHKKVELPNKTCIYRLICEIVIHGISEEKIKHILTNCHLASIIKDWNLKKTNTIYLDRYYANQYLTRSCWDTQKNKVSTKSDKDLIGRSPFYLLYTVLNDVKSLGYEYMVLHAAAEPVPTNGLIILYQSMGFEYLGVCGEETPYNVSDFKKYYNFILVKLGSNFKMFDDDGNLDLSTPQKKLYNLLYNLVGTYFDEFLYSYSNDNLIEYLIENSEAKGMNDPKGNLSDDEKKNTRDILNENKLYISGIENNERRVVVKYIYTIFYNTIHNAHMGMQKAYMVGKIQDIINNIEKNMSKEAIANFESNMKKQIKNATVSYKNDLNIEGEII